jgi:hypothetical protein
MRPKACSVVHSFSRSCSSYENKRPVFPQAGLNFLKNLNRDTQPLPFGLFQSQRT